MMTSQGMIAFSIFGFDVMWYGIAIASGMLTAGALAYLRAAKFGLDKERILDIALYCIPAGLIASIIHMLKKDHQMLQSGRFPHCPNIRI